MSQLAMMGAIMVVLRRFMACASAHASPRCGAPGAKPDTGQSVFTLFTHRDLPLLSFSLPVPRHRDGDGTTGAAPCCVIVKSGVVGQVSGVVDLSGIDRRGGSVSQAVMITCPQLSGYVRT